MNDESRSAESAPGGVTPLASNLQAGKFLTVAEVAGILRLSKMSVYRLIHFGPTRGSAIRPQLSGD